MTVGAKIKSSDYTPLAVTAFALGSCLVALLSLFPAQCFDMWWHLQTGQLILRESSVPRQDPFTYTALGRPWITHEWLAEVLLYGLYKLGGVDLLVVLKALVAALAVALGAMAGLMGSQWRLRLPAAALGVILAAPLIAPRALVRPHMLTALFLGLTLVLLRLEATTGHRRWRTLLVPLFLIWANIHSGFVLGFALIGLTWLGEWLSPRLGGSEPLCRPSWRGRAISLLAVILVTLFNPHHVEAMLYPFRLVLRQEVTSNIAELRSIFHPAYRDALFLKVMVVACVALLTLLVLSRRRLQWPLLLPGLFFLVIAFSSLRGVSEFAVILPALIAAHGEILGTRRVVGLASSAVMVLLALSGGVAAICWGQPMGSENNRRIGLGIDPVNRPDAAVRFLEETWPSGRVFNVMAFGGYFIHRLWPEKEVFIDGRLDVFPPGFLKGYSLMMDTGEGWDEAVDRYGISVAVVDYSDDPYRDQGLRNRLRDDPNWVCVYFGDNVLVYALKTPDNEGIITKFGSSFDPSLRSQQSLSAFSKNANTDDFARTVSAMRRMVEVTPDQKAPLMVLAQLLLESGHAQEAVTPLQAAVDLEPSSIYTRLNLAQALSQCDAIEEARVELTEILRRDPKNTSAMVLLADVERSAGHPTLAIEHLRRAADLEPNNYVVQLRLGVLAAESGDMNRARYHFERALTIRPGDSAAMRNLQTLREIQERSRTPSPENRR